MVLSVNVQISSLKVLQEGDQAAEIDALDALIRQLGFHGREAVLLLDGCPHVLQEMEEFLLNGVCLTLLGKVGKLHVIVEAVSGFVQNVDVDLVDPTLANGADDLEAVTVQPFRLNKKDSAKIDVPLLAGPLVRRCGECFFQEIEKQVLVENFKAVIRRIGVAGNRGIERLFQRSIRLYQDT